MAEPQSQSVRMHTRSQGLQPAGPGGGVSDNSAPGGGVTDQPLLEIGERLSVMAPTPSQTQSEVSATMPDISEPVTTASDRKIRNLLAQTSRGKMMLDAHLIEMTKMAERHMEYVKAGEEAQMLIDRPYQLKSKVRKGEQLEEKLIYNLSNLSLLLELLNLDGDEVQKAEGVKLGNKVTKEITKYKGLVE